MILLHLFSSRTRVKLLSIFLLHPQQDFFVRELTRLTTEQINSIRRELDNLESIGFLVSHQKNNKKFYCLNNEFLIIDELKSVFTKLSDDRYELVQGISQYGDIEVLAISDSLNSEGSNPCEVVIVSNIKDRESLRLFMETLEQKYNRSIRYVLLDRQDFTLRHQCHDRFLTHFFLSQPIVLIDKLNFSW